MMATNRRRPGKINSFNMHGSKQVTQAKQRNLQGNNEQWGTDKFCIITMTDEVN